MLGRALGKSREIDGDFGMMEHPDKRELFANRPDTVEDLRFLVAEKGKVDTEFKNLGINFDCTGQGKTFKKEMIQQRARQSGEARKQY